jgi:Flp pilus assembly protein TadD
VDQPGVAVEDKRGVLALAGAIDRRAGQSADAVGHLRAAVDLLSTTPAVPAAVRAAVLNEFGAALLDVRRPAEAERVLAEAQQMSSGSTTSRIENNRGAAAAQRGDRPAAERWYRAALNGMAGASASSEERRAIEKNLSDLTAVR